METFPFLFTLTGIVGWYWTRALIPVTPTASRYPTATMSGRVTTGAKIIRSIVKNDAVKTDPPEIYGWRAFAMAGSACFGGMLFGFDIGTIGGVLELNEFQM